MDTAVSPSGVDIPLMPTPSTSSASPSVELRTQDYEVLSGNTTDLSSAHTSPDEARNSHHQVGEPTLPHREPKSNIADSLKVVQRKHQSAARAVVYESQISPELEGIKLKIKKSPTAQELPPQILTTNNSGSGRAPKSVRLRLPKGRGKSATAAGGKGRKRKRKKKGHSEDEVSDEDDKDIEAAYFDYNGAAAAAAAAFAAADVEMEDKSAPQSIWADVRMPPEILTKIFMEVTYTEGCVPTLVRYCSHPSSMPPSTSGV